MENCLLAISHVTTKHTSEKLANQITSILEGWNVKDKVSNCTVDGANNA